MANLFLDNICLIVLFPFWLFLISMIGRFFAVYINKNVMHILMLLSTILGIILSAVGLCNFTPEMILEAQIPFIKVNDFIISTGVYVDRLSIIFAMTLYLISLMVQIFSISYMRDEKKSYRFYALLNLFIFAMSALFFSPNLFQMYFFWEIVGITSYLLIGFEYFKQEKSIASRKVFIFNRIGDTALIASIILCSYLMYAYAPNKSFVTLDFVDLNTISTLVYAYTSEPLFWVICLMFLFGSLVKSAQFPFYTWLQDAMEAKLPVSSLLHSSTLVALGIFLALRMLPFFTMDSRFMNIIVVLGLLTAIICSISACSQLNPKKVLAYSTSAQFGLIFMAIGLMNIKAAVAYFVAHAFIKSNLFLCLPNENSKWSKVKFVLFLVAGLSLSGLLFSGLIAKEYFATDLADFYKIIFSIISFITAFYIIRIALVLADRNDIEKCCLNKLELFSCLGLLVLNVAFYFYLRNQVEYKIAEPFWSALTAWVCVYILYRKNAFWKVPFIYNWSFNGFYLDEFYTKICTKIYSGFSKICMFVEDKIFANYIPVVCATKKSVKIAGFVEKNIMNAYVNLTVKASKKISIMGSRLQNSSIQKYNMYAFIIVTLVLSCLILAYSFIINYLGGLNG